MQGLIEPAIEYATESGAFDHALELAHACCPAKLPGIHLKHALFLEDEERFKEVSQVTADTITITITITVFPAAGVRRAWGLRLRCLGRGAGERGGGGGRT